MAGKAFHRRELLTGAGRCEPAAVHVSSAVVAAKPEDAGSVAERLAALPDTEVRHAAGGKIVIVMEGPTSGALGERLTEIALMDGVLSANMVYEAVDPADAPGDSEGGDP